ncbi:MAG: (Fe-S)-binding protein [Hyphomicrobiaceae bacterium]|nr:(Fe-S)-binding protein [Hyphomicrobiaceae bacterium]
MAVTAPARERITFWFGCNMLRHAEMIRLSMLLLERAGYDVEAAGGPAYCCGTAHDHAPDAASTMAGRTVERFNAAKAEEGRGTVVTWCPSCHLHMSDIMAPGNAAQFDIAHVTEILAGAGERLAPLLTREVRRKVLLHRHAGLNTRVPVNDSVAGLLRRIPGLELVEGPVVPGHMCSALGAVPGALKSALGLTWDAARSAGCDTLSTIFHSCHREAAALDGRDGIAICNWVHLVAEAMGVTSGDAYLGWRKGGMPDADAIARADPRLYAKLIEPELRKPRPL